MSNFVKYALIFVAGAICVGLGLVAWGYFKNKKDDKKEAPKAAPAAQPAQ